MRRPEPRSGPGVSVHADWIGGLSEAYLRAFRSYSEEIEAPYLMFSIVLNEAIGLRNSGSVAMSVQLVVLASGLCRRSIKVLEDMLCSLAEHCKHYGTTPSVASLQSGEFHGHRGQRSALKSLLNRALLSPHAQFLSKIGTLRAIIAHMGDDFCVAADDLVFRGPTIEAVPLWSAMDTGHFDLNTCLRESLILLKCFLRVLPGEQLLLFQNTVSSHKTRRPTAPVVTEFVTLGPHRTIPPS